MELIGSAATGGATKVVEMIALLLQRSPKAR